MNKNNRKITGTILGVFGIILWFMPMAYVDFMGEEAYQAGNHIGGIAYLLLFASLAYAALSWFEQHIPRIIAGTVASLISLLFVIQAGSSGAWGLYVLMLVSIVSIALAVRDQKSLTN